MPRGDEPPRNLQWSQTISPEDLLAEPPLPWLTEVSLTIWFVLLIPCVPLCLISGTAFDGGPTPEALMRPTNFQSCAARERIASMQLIVAILVVVLTFAA